MSASDHEFGIKRQRLNHKLGCSVRYHLYPAAYADLDFPFHYSGMKLCVIIGPYIQGCILNTRRKRVFSLFEVFRFYRYFLYVAGYLFAVHQPFHFEGVRFGLQQIEFECHGAANWCWENS